MLKGGLYRHSLQCEYDKQINQAEVAVLPMRPADGRWLWEGKCGGIITVAINILHVNEKQRIFICFHSRTLGVTGRCRLNPTNDSQEQQQLSRRMLHCQE